ncbi:MAG: 1-deoxy-D-xylulose-5-phosphate reductoisomerase [Betaproteobacteria bacterium]|nr:1-deoxy-D-xylulose-5-phosphate reductoisomerase [Betaproteobacteria bacterium]
MKRTRNIAILGATGSIGRSTLDVAARHPDRYRVVALSAARKVEELAALCSRHGAAYACIADASLAGALESRLRALGSGAKVLAGAAGLLEAAALPEVDCVMAAIVGGAGLEPTLAAAQAGKKLLLANKEALVMAGPVFMETVRRHGATLLPIDSEHNAVFQCLPPAFLAGDLEISGIRRILLTGSGGPFRSRPRSELGEVTPEQACARPNWVMGKKISVDSATMMNKGLEVIEAHWLFGARAEQIQVVVHPQSVIHSMVEYADGSVIAQMGNPDMRTPIAQALAFPDRIEAGVPSLDLFSTGALTFEAPDFDRFPALGLAYLALEAGGTAPTIMNAANEVAVAAFLEGRLSFLHITAVIEETLQQIAPAPMRTLEDVVAADAAARARAALAANRLATLAA